MDKHEWWEYFNDCIDDEKQLFGIRLYKHIEEDGGYNEPKEICEGCFKSSYGDEIYTNDGDDWTLDEVYGEGIEEVYGDMGGYPCDDCGEKITHTGEISKNGRSLTVPSHWKGV